jgi:cobalt-zinc-cadmium resistance protein CzcA
MEREIERTLARFPEVSTVFSQIGTADVANDPLPPSEGDIYLILKPRREWPDRHKPKEKLIHEIEQQLDHLPGQHVRVHPADRGSLQRADRRRPQRRCGARVRRRSPDAGWQSPARSPACSKASGDPPTSSVEQVAGLPTISIEIDREAAARYGLSTTDVQTTVRTALAGTEAGEIIQGDRRYEIVVRLPERIRSDVRDLEQLPIPLTSMPALWPR